MLFIPQDSRQIRQDYISKHNFTRKKQVTILKITDGEKWHFLALKSIKLLDDTYKPTQAFSRLMKNISSNSQENYYCYACFHTFRTQSKLNEHNKLCKDRKNCPVKVPKEGKNILSHGFGSKSIKMKYIILIDTESILEKYDTIENDENIPWTIKKDMHTVCGYSMTHLSNHDN